MIIRITQPNENRSYIYVCYIRWLMKCLWGRYEMLMKYLWGRYEVFMNCWWSAYEVPMRCLWNSYNVVVKCLWVLIGSLLSAYAVLMRYLWGAYEVFMKCLWSAYGVLVKCLWSASYWPRYREHRGAQNNELIKSNVPNFGGLQKYPPQPTPQRGNSGKMCLVRFW